MGHIGPHLFEVDIDTLDATLVIDRKVQKADLVTEIAGEIDAKTSCRRNVRRRS